MSPIQQSFRTRLYIEGSLASGTDVVVDERQAHYLVNVMRRKTGNLLAVFNGRDGEWLAEIVNITKKQVILKLQKQLREQSYSPDLWLLAAPLRNGKTEGVIEQATELGISCFIPVLTQFTVANRINQNRFVTIAMEAAEQCERLDIPEIRNLMSLTDLLSGWNPQRTIIYGDESGAGKQPKELFHDLEIGSYAVLIGPEGGFSAEELDILDKAVYAVGVCMGPRIMRANTAAIAAITLAQSWLGDWDNKPAFRGMAIGER